MGRGGLPLAAAAGAVVAAAGLAVKLVRRGPKEELGSLEAVLGDNAADLEPAVRSLVPPRPPPHPPPPAPGRAAAPLQRA